MGSQLARDLDRLQLPEGAALSYPDDRGSLFHITFKPHEYLWISDAVTFEFRIPVSYNAMPPAVTCLSADFIRHHSEKVPVEESGQVLLNILKLGPGGWSRGYTISDVVHCIHQRLLILGVPHVRVIASGSAGSESPLARRRMRSLGSQSAPPLRSGQHGLQGKRPTMEDETVMLDALSAGASSYGFYAVYDGHGGTTASGFAAATLHKHFVDNITSGKDLRHSLWAAFASTDGAFEAKHSGGDDTADLSGTTAAVLVVDGRTVLVGNVGDSRVVLSRDGTAVALTVDHKADRPDEIARIVNAGGIVVHNRVMGRLAVSRAIGDIVLKTGPAGAPMVTALPELFETQLCDKDELFVLGCDGLFDVLSSQQVIDTARLAMSSGSAPAEIAQQLATQALKLGSADNISVIVVQVGNGVPRGSIKAPPSVDVADTLPASATSKSPAASGGSTPSRKPGHQRYSSNPFSRNFASPRGGRGGGPSPTRSPRRPSGTSGGGGGGRGGSDSSSSGGVGTMLAGMRLSDGDGGGAGGGAGAGSGAGSGSSLPWSRGAAAAPPHMFAADVVPRTPAMSVPQSSVGVPAAVGGVSVRPDATPREPAVRVKTQREEDDELMKFLLDDDNFK